MLYPPRKLLLRMRMHSSVNSGLAGGCGRKSNMEASSLPSRRILLHLRDYRNQPYHQLHSFCLLKGISILSRQRTITESSRSESPPEYPRKGSPLSRHLLTLSSGGGTVWTFSIHSETVKVIIERVVVCKF